MPFLLILVVTFCTVNVEAKEFYAGGEIREFYEMIRSPAWGQSQTDSNGYLLQRYMLYGGWRSQDVRVHAQLKSGSVAGSSLTARVPDKDIFDVHEVYFELGPITLGRQEIQLGSSRLVSVRDGPNVRRSFDGFRFHFFDEDHRLSIFGLKPALTKPGILDDVTSDDETLWGLYQTLPLTESGYDFVDLYYLGYWNRERRYVQGEAEETRHMIGARFFNRKQSFDYNFEAVYQFGRFGVGTIDAWTVASDTGFTFQDTKLRPRIALKVDLASGDADAADSSLGTFNPLFPRASYFGWLSLIGAANLFDIHPELKLQLFEAMQLRLDWDFFWRHRADDGIYDSSGKVLRFAQATNAMYIGSQPQVELTWKLRSDIEFGTSYAHFFAGDFIRESGTHDDVDLTNAWFSFKF